MTQPQLLVLLGVHLFLTFICFSTKLHTLGFNKWYLYSVLLIPFVNVIFTIIILDIEMDSAKFKSNLAEDLNRHLTGTIEELRERSREDRVKRIKRSIRGGDYVVIPNNEGWAEDIRGKRGLITNIEDDYAYVKFHGDNRNWYVKWQTFYDYDLIVHGENTLKPFEFC